VNDFTNTHPNQTTGQLSGSRRFVLSATLAVILTACSAEDGARRYCSSVDFIPGTKAYDNCVKTATELKMDVENR